MSELPAIRPTWLDRAVGIISPERALRRMRARVATELVARHYEAVSTGRRTQGWNRATGDANAVVGPALSRLRTAARDLVRNNGHAKKARNKVAEHVVGWGIVAKPMPKNARALELWKSWAESPLCDADARLNFYGIQKLAMRTIVESGEVLVRARYRRPEDGLPIPLQLQVLEPDYIDTNKNQWVRNGSGQLVSRIVHGIEFDALGRRVAYWLFPDHPGSTDISGVGFGAGASRRIPADGIIHVYFLERPGQVRGASWFAASLLKFKDFDEYSDATLMKQKVAACLAAITTDTDGSASPLGTADSSVSPEVDSLEPGMILNVPPGREVTVVQPPSVREHGDFSRITLHEIAAGIGTTYEDLTGDYCVAPETRVLRADLHWVTANTLKPGQEIVAFDEHRPGGQGRRRKWRKARVVRAGRRELSRKRVVTDNGAVTVSDDHQFLCIGHRGAGLQSRSESPAALVGYGQMWVRADKLRPGDRIAFLCAPWEEGRSHDHGYLKGMADGEGWLDRKDAKIGIAQNAGPVFDETGEALSALGFNARRRRANSQGKVFQWSLMGIGECLRFLGEVRPTRLLERADTVYAGRMMSGGAKKSGVATYATVQAVDDLGVGPVVTLETTTRTLITEGFCSHNSQVNFSSARMSRLSHWDQVHDWRWDMIIPQLCEPVWAWAMQAAGIMGLATAGGVRWTPPPMPMIEPDKEGLAHQRNIRTGTRTLPQVLRELGEDPDEVFAEIAETNATLDKLGIVLDSDPRKTTQAGNPATVAAPAEPEPDPEPDPDDDPKPPAPDDDEDDDDDDEGVRRLRIERGKDGRITHVVAEGVRRRTLRKGRARAGK